MSNRIQRINSLIKKDYQLEFRNKSALAGAFLYLIATNYVCFLAFNKVISITTWIALFWIIILFASINLISKSFQGESKNNFLYIYSLASADEIIAAKLIYNSLALFVLTLIGYITFSFLVGNVVNNHLLFIFVQFLGCLGFSSVLTLMAAIASKTDGNFSLISILSLPLLLPLLLVLLKLSKVVIDDLANSIFWEYATTLVGINLLTAALSYILFNYLWRS